MSTNNYSVFRNKTFRTWTVINALLVGYGFSDYVHTREFSIVYVIGMLSLLAQQFYKLHLTGKRSV